MTRGTLFPAKILLFVFALLLAFPSIVSGQDSNSSTPTADDGPDETIWFVIAPEGKSNGDFFSVELEAGSQATLKGDFGNGSEIPVESLLYAADVVSPVNGGLNINDSTFPVSGPTTWLDFPTEIVQFDAKEIRERSFTVSVPAGTPPGQYITGIAIETLEAAPPPGELPILVKYRFVAAVLITVPGPVEAEFSIGEISVLVDEASTTIRGTIENTGNIRVRPAGSITLTNEDGVEITSAQLEMQSVYAGHTVPFEITLPATIPEGAYTADVALSDAETGAAAELTGIALDVVAAGPPSPLTLTQIAIAPMPSMENVVFAQVTVTIENSAQPMSGIRVVLTVYRDGVEVDSAELASSITVPTGASEIDQPYIPETGSWESGVYTFAITISAVDPQSGSETVIATAKPEGSFEIP
jgi:hypothetical protein